MIDKKAKNPAQPWHDELNRYEKKYETWKTQGRKILKRFRDERNENSEESRFNILWANARILKPAIYSKPPKPEVSRRFNDKDPVARTASTIIERVLDFEITQYDDYHTTLSNVVEDRLLPGRGQAWIRYEPTIETVDAEPQITEDIQSGEGDYPGIDVGESSEENSLAGEMPEQYEQITHELTPVDYVAWEDFAHLPARTWEEVTWVARRVYLSRKEGMERFGDIFKAVPLTHCPDDDDKENLSDDVKKAEIWEIWCKTSKKVHWIAKDFDEILDTKDDPLELEEFFPCPKPFSATTTTNSMVPVADYIMYQDQAQEIDIISARIRHLTSALKVNGIYAADLPEIERLITEGVDGSLIPVQNWMAYQEKGGLAGAIHMVPLQDIIRALQQLYVSREACKQIIYEITGISDILRGASNANETLGAQQIKAQFGSLTLNSMKDELARFARELLRMKAEVICSKYQPETLMQASGIMTTPDAQYAEQAIQMLQNDTIREFNIDIETDSLIQVDEQTEKAARVEFLTATGAFLEKAVMAGQQSPQLIPLMGEMLLFGIRGFKVGRQLEGVFEDTLQRMNDAEKAKQGQPPQPSPEQIAQQQEQMKAQQMQQAEQMKAQAEMQAKQMEMQNQQQLEAAKLQNIQTIEAAKNQLEQMKIQAKSQEEAMKLQQKTEAEEKDRELERWKAELEASTRILTAQMQAERKESEQVDNEDMQEVDAMGRMMGMHSEAMDKLHEIMEVMQRPKTVIRGKDNLIIGVSNG